MPTFDFTSPEGKTYSVQGPDGATPEQAFQILQQHIGANAPEPAAPDIGENRQSTIAALRGIPIAGAYVDKGAAALNAAAQPYLETGLSHAGTFAEREAENEKLIKEATDAYEASHPIGTTAGKIAMGSAAMAPAMALAPEAFGLQGATLAGRALAGAASGGAIGGADAAARGESPVNGALIGAGLGAAGPIAGRAVGAVVDRLRGAPTAAEAIPAGQAIKDAAQEGYDAVRSMGVTVRPDAVRDLAGGIRKDFREEGFRDYLAPKTFGVLDELENGDAFTSRASGADLGAQQARDLADVRAKYGDHVADAFEQQQAGVPGQAATSFSDLHGLRRALGKAAQSADPVERAAASRAISRVDAYLDNIPESDVIGGDAQKAASLLKEANANYSVAKLAERLKGKIDAAELQAASANSGANLENALRQRIKDILKSEKLRRGFAQPELLQMQQIVRGTAPQNVLRWIGNYLGGGGGLGALASGAGGFVAGGPAGAFLAPAMGIVAKKIGARMTESQLARLDEMIRLRAPHSEQARNVAAALEAARQQRLAAAQTRGTVVGRAINPAANDAHLGDRKERRR